MDFERAKEFALSKLKTELADNLYYHGLHHTLDVCESAERLGRIERISESDMVLLKTAAMFHDIGFIKRYRNNEPLAAEIAREVLPNFGYTPEDIEVVCGCIMATVIPQAGKSHLEQIICDSDLDYLGRDDFFMIAHCLRTEWIEYNIFSDSLKAWYELQIKFFNAHNFYTEGAKEIRGKKKEYHLSLFKELLSATS